jgi:hypothetical protein
MDWILEPIEVIGAVGNWMELFLRFKFLGNIFILMMMMMV